MSLRSPKAQADKLFQSAKRFVCADRYHSAIVTLNQAIGHAPTAELYDYRGIVLTLTGQNEAALESFARALELATTKNARAEIYFHRGLLFARDGSYEPALLDLARACRLNRFDPTYREACDHLKKEKKARDRYEDQTD